MCTFLLFVPRTSTRRLCYSMGFHPLLNLSRTIFLTWLTMLDLLIVVHWIPRRWQVLSGATSLSRNRIKFISFLCSSLWLDHKESNWCSILSYHEQGRAWRPLIIHSIAFPMGGSSQQVKLDCVVPVDWPCLDDVPLPSPESRLLVLSSRACGLRSPESRASLF